MRKIVTLFLCAISLILVMLPAHLEATDYRQTGTYPVVVEYYDEQTGTFKEKVVYMTVVSPNTVKNSENDEAIDGYDLLVEKGTMADISDTELIKIANVHAWKLSNGEQVAIVKVETTLIDQKNNRYSASFYTEKKTKLTINIIELEHILFEQTATYINPSANIFSDNFSLLMLLAFLIVILPLILLVTGLYVLQHYKEKTRELIYEEWDSSTTI